MPHLHTNYIRTWNADRKIRGGKGGYASTAISGLYYGKIYMGPVNFSINAYTDASGIVEISALTVMSMYGMISLPSGMKLVPLVITPISFSTYSYSGTAGSLLLAAGSMWASGSLCMFVPSLSDVVIAGSAPAICRMTAIVCSGPAS